jgi:2,4-dienoyl-CoA reductase-like NADH-dependent reductase (Old Yellow Enzyme family)
MQLTDSLTLPCGVTLKNRLAKAAMTEGVADEYNRATDRLETLYRRWAEGGAGLLLTGNVLVDKRYLERPRNVVIDGPQSPEQMQRLTAFARAATDHDVHIWPQLSHAGRQSPKTVVSEPVGPSAVQVKLPGGQFGQPRALSGAEVEDVIERFAHAAAVCQEAGFTGVQIHGAHGYLLSEFLNPLTNQRDDEWGGSLQNRARLLLETVAAVRSRVGSGFPVSVKLNSSDFQKGGFDFDDCLQVVEWLDSANIDLLEISGGSYEQPKMMGWEGMEPTFEKTVSASTKAREAYFITYAEKIAEKVKTPLMVTGGFRSRAGMEEALQSGAANVIGIARPMCIHPDVPAQLMDGRLEQAVSWENLLAIGPGIFGPDSSVAFLKAINGFAVMAYFYQNLFRLADGLEAKEKMPLLRTLIKHQMHEAKMGKTLVRD